MEFFLIDVISELGVCSGSTPICSSGTGSWKDPVWLINVKWTVQYGLRDTDVVSERVSETEMRA